MEYASAHILKNGCELVLRSGVADDGAAELDLYRRGLTETQHLLGYPDERWLTLDEEEAFLQVKAESTDEVEILAFADGRLVGTAGLSAVGRKEKLRHRAEFGVLVLKEWWGQGIGGLLLNACIECARKVGYSQIELSVVSDNERAVALYRKAGFIEYGRNPRGFLLRSGAYQELALMRMELR